MNGNQIFSFNRFMLLLRHDLREHWQKLALGLAALIGIMVIIGIMSVSMVGKVHFINIESWNRRVLFTELGWMTAALYVIGCYVASVAFKSMSTPSGALSGIMLPASQFEKFVYRWVAIVPGFFIVFFLCAMFGDWVRIIYVEARESIAVPTVDWWTLLTDPKKVGYFKGMTTMVLSIYFASQSFFLLGALVWARLSFIKTFVCLGAVMLFYIWFGSKLYDFFCAPGVLYGEPKWISGADEAVSLGVVVCCAIMIVNYCLTFMRLRETDMIRRW